MSNETIQNHNALHTQNHINIIIGLCALYIQARDTKRSQTNTVFFLFERRVKI